MAEQSVVNRENRLDNGSKLNANISYHGTTNINQFSPQANAESSKTDDFLKLMFDCDSNTGRPNFTYRARSEMTFRELKSLVHHELGCQFDKGKIVLMCNNKQLSDETVVKNVYLSERLSENCIFVFILGYQKPSEDHKSSESSQNKQVFDDSGISSRVSAEIDSLENIEIIQKHVKQQSIAPFKKIYHIKIRIRDRLRQTRKIVNDQALIRETLKETICLTRNDTEEIFDELKLQLTNAANDHSLQKKLHLHISLVESAFSKLIRFENFTYQEINPGPEHLTSLIDIVKDLIDEVQI